MSLSTPLPSSDFVGDLTAGLFTPSSASFFGAVILCALEIVACCVAFQPTRLARIDSHYLMEADTDQYPELSRRLLALRVGPPLGELHVAYLGGSQATRALAHLDEAALSRELSKAAGRPMKFDLLSADTQRFEESLAITDQLPPSFTGVLVQVVSDHKDDYNRREHRAETRGRIAVIDAPSLEPFFAEEGYFPSHSGIFFYDNLGFFAARRVAALRLVPVDRWAGPAETAEAARQRFRATMWKLREKGRRAEAEDDDILRRIHEPAPFFTTSRPVIAKLVANLHARGISIVFLEPPENPARDKVFGERIDRFRRDMTAFAKDNDAAFWDFTPELVLDATDFQDEVHLGSPRARRAFEALLMEQLGEHVRARFEKAPGG